MNKEINNYPTVEVVTGLNDISRIIKETNCKIWYGKDGIVLVLTDLNGIMINVNKSHAAYSKLETILLSGNNEIHRKSRNLLAKENRESESE